MFEEANVAAPDAETATPLVDELGAEASPAVDISTLPSTATDASAGATDAFGAGLGGLDDPFGESPLLMDTVSLDDPPAGFESPDITVSSRPNTQFAQTPAAQPPGITPAEPAIAVTPTGPNDTAEAALARPVFTSETVTPSEPGRGAGPVTAQPTAIPGSQVQPTTTERSAAAARAATVSSESSYVHEMSEAIAHASSFAALTAALEPVQAWPWTAEQEAGIKRCKTCALPGPSRAQPVDGSALCEAGLVCSSLASWSSSLLTPGPRQVHSRYGCGCRLLRVLHQ